VDSNAWNALQSSHYSYASISDLSKIKLTYARSISRQKQLLTYLWLLNAKATPTFRPEVNLLHSLTTIISNCRRETARCWIRNFI